MKPELLAPAGNLEKLKMAVLYGADAVYLAGQRFGLRANAGNFTREEMEEGIQFAHDHGKKVYITMNIIAHEDDIEVLPEYLDDILSLKPDALIVQDPGIVRMIRAKAPEIPLHLSTQASTANHLSAAFWHDIGFSRVVLAREMSLAEITKMRRHAPASLEIEAFVHGAMCVSYSGRCLISNVMAGRDANQGDCAQPCRWKYHLVEEKRPGEYMPVEEDSEGTYLYSAKDLCMIEHIPEMLKAGVGSLKIEGRMKSAYYVATVVRAYRQAIDAYLDDPDGWHFRKEWMNELCKASHRPLSTGFYFGRPNDQDSMTKDGYIREYKFIGIVRSYDEVTGIATIEQRNRFSEGEEIEVISPGSETCVMTIQGMKNADGDDITVAPHPVMTVYMRMPVPVKPMAILRRDDR